MDGSEGKDEFILGNRVEPIEDGYDKSIKYQSVAERYYSPRYCLDVGRSGGDYCVLFHSNRICVVTLAPSHVLLKQNKTIAKLDFQISTNVDRLSNKVSGKAKHGAQRLQENSAIFFAECTDGTVVKICPGIPGKLVEINEALLDDPNLLVKCPEDKGFVAVILPPIPVSERYKKMLLNHEQYLEALAKREALTAKADE